MARVVVLHRHYGCETGCCGHVVEVDDEQVGDFVFEHPDSDAHEDRVAFAREMITEVLGAEHVADLDWEWCEALDD